MSMSHMVSQQMEKPSEESMNEVSHANGDDSKYSGPGGKAETGVTPVLGRGITPLPASTYDNDYVQPALHWRTWVAILSLCVLNFSILFALGGISSILSYIATELNGAAYAAWVPNTLNLVQAVAGPLLAFSSDIFQARKLCIMIPCVLAAVGAAIAPGSTTIFRVIGANILIGFGFSLQPLGYAVPAEIMPRRWRPITQAIATMTGNLGGVSSPLIAGALVQASAHSGWRNYFWIQVGLWAFTALGIFVGYRPLKRVSPVAHASLGQKIKALDLPGMALLCAGLTLLLVGLNLGGNPRPWSSGPVVGCIVAGCVALVMFGLYEWKGTSRGFLDHRLWNRNFSILVAMMFVDGVMAFAIVVYYPQMTVALYEPNAFKLSLRVIPFKLASILSGPFYGYVSSKYRVIKVPLMVGFGLWCGGLIGLACAQPGSGKTVIGFVALAGFGFGGPLILIITGVQLVTPRELIATSTSITTTSRAIGGAVSTAVYGAVVLNRQESLLPRYIRSAVLAAGLPETSVAAYVKALIAKKPAVAAAVADVNETIMAAGVEARRQALADAFRPVYIIAVAFGVVCVGICLLLTKDLTDTMTYRVDAPVEKLVDRSKTTPRQEAAEV